MELFLAMMAFVMVLVGLLGAVIPMLPGPPLSFVGLLLLWCCGGYDITTTTLWVTGVLMVVITILDYVAPIWMTNIGGGTKSGVNGATIGMFLGLFFMPWGLVVGPFIGAFVGELVGHTSKDKALKVAFMSFLSILLTTGIKLIYSMVLLMMVVVQLIDKIFR
jgi:uncharacterized protein YqgC (DUF456 family)